MLVIIDYQYTDKSVNPKLKNPRYSTSTKAI
jgi:hypothetical protein